MDTTTGEENVPKMDTWSKLFFSVFSIAILLSVGISFYKYMIVRDYVIEAQVDCDPAVESCFVTECDPESTDVETMCTGNPAEDISFYKIIRKNAMNISVCDPNQGECVPLSCAEGELDCEYVLCEEGNADGVRCSTVDDAAVMAAPADEGSDGADVGQDISNESGSGNPIEPAAADATTSSEAAVIGS